MADGQRAAQDLSLAERLHRHPDRDRILARLGDEAATDLGRQWAFWRRPEQALPEGPWDTWLLLAGRGFGKTRTGCEAACDLIRDQPEPFTEAGLVGRTSTEVRKILVEGVAGIVRCAQRRAGWTVSYQPALRHVKIRTSGGRVCQVNLYTADEPDSIRGSELAWALCDEYAAWPHKTDDKGNTALTNLRLALRGYTHPRLIVTTTPKAGHKGLKELLAEAGVVVTRGSSFANIRNLGGAYLRTLGRYKGTRLEAQEIHGELQDAIEGALWHPDRWQDAVRLTGTPPPLAHKIVSVDPSVTNTEESDETGIMVMGTDERDPAHAHLIADLSGKRDVGDDAAVIVAAYRDHQCDEVVVEVNNGGDWIPHAVHAIDASIPVRSVRATRGKRTRAEPIEGLTRQGRIRIWGDFVELKDQATTWVPGEDSPDRLDAFVWGMWALLVEPEERDVLRYRDDPPARLGAIHPVTGVPIELGRILAGLDDDED